MRKLLATLLILCCTALSAQAQTAITLPIAANAVADLGNGPVKVRMTSGNASIFTAQGSGVGSTSGSSTTLTLTSTPATPPIVGALISGAGITSGTTVAAYNGTTTITLSAATTVAGGTAVSWGAACSSTLPAQYIQASVSAGYYIMYTQARVCAVSPGGPVNTLIIEPVFIDGGLGLQTFAGGITADAPIMFVLGGDATGDLYYRNSGGTLSRLGEIDGSCIKGVAGIPTYGSCAGTPSLPGGSNTQVQYNNSSALGGISGVTSNGTSMTFAPNDLIINNGSATAGFATVSSGGVVGSAALGTNVQTALAITLNGNGGLLSQLEASNTTPANPTTISGGSPLGLVFEDFNGHLAVAANNTSAPYIVTGSGSIVYNTTTLSIGTLDPINYGAQAQGFTELGAFVSLNLSAIGAGGGMSGAVLQFSGAADAGSFARGPVLLGNQIGQIAYNGFDGSGTNTYAYGAYEQAVTLENWGASAHGTQFQWCTVAIGGSYGQPCFIMLLDGQKGLQVASPGINASPIGAVTPAAGHFTTLSATGALKLGNAYVAGAPTATGYLTLQDSTGTTYKVPACTGC